MDQTERIDGQIVHSVVAAAFRRMAADFKKIFGLTLHVSSGYRTNAEQRRIFFERYREQASGNGPYNDVRYYEGKRWVRHHPGGTVAVPGTSLHESFRALDIRDSGIDWGVTRAGNARSNWIRSNAKNYGFAPNGYNFGEPWHIEYQGSLTGGGTVKYSVEHIKKVQIALKELGYNLGPAGIDGLLGTHKVSFTSKAVIAFQTKEGLLVDGLPGPVTLTRLEQRVKEKREEEKPSPDPDPIPEIDYEKLANMVVDKLSPIIIEQLVPQIVDEVAESVLVEIVRKLSVKSDEE